MKQHVEERSRKAVYYQQMSKTFLVRGYGRYIWYAPEARTIILPSWMELM